MAGRGDPEGYYRALGVPRTATADEIRLAFRERAMASHPDQAGETADGEAFRLVREAYEVLRDPLRRMAYDASGLAAAEPGSGAARPPPGFDAEPDPAPGRGARPGARRAAGARAAPGATGDDDTRPDDAAATDAPFGTNWASDAAAGAAWATGFGRRARGTGRGSSQGGPQAGRQAGWQGGLRGRSSVWLGVTAGGLALTLLLALGSLWSANRQLADRETVLADAYERLAQLGEAQADLGTRYRSLAFLDLERMLQRDAMRSFGGEPFASRDGAGVAADRGRAAYLHQIKFSGGRFDLGQEQEQNLARALVEIARLIERLPADADWLIVLEAQAPRAAWADQVAVDAWEPALLRLATVLEAILARGLPSERFAVRFNAGFAPLPAPADAAADIVFERVLVKLVCCGG